MDALQRRRIHYSHLETFESGALTVPGVSLAPGWVVPGPSSLTDSVDADDGSIDGSGTRGHSLFSNGALSTFVFTFNAAALGGQLPTHVGIVWTDVGVTTGVLGVGPVTFQAFAPGRRRTGAVDVASGHHRDYWNMPPAAPVE